MHKGSSAICAAHVRLADLFPVDLTQPPELLDAEQKMDSDEQRRKAVR